MRDKIELALQGCINSYKGIHGDVVPFLQNEEWHIVENDIWHCGTYQNTLWIIITGSTGEWADWKSNLDQDQLVRPYGNNNSPIKVHEGFISSYERHGFRNPMLDIVRDFDIIYYVGHSRGGALAQLAAVDCQFNYLTKDITLITAGSPRVGNKAFAESLDKRVPRHYRITNREDFVTKVPYAPFYWHAGKEIHIGGHNPLMWLPVIRAAGSFDHYPQAYFQNFREYKGEI